MPWPVPPAKTIFDRLAASFEDLFSRLKPDTDPAAISRAARSSHGVLSILARTFALEAREVHDHVAFYGRQYFVDTAEQEFVRRHANIWGVKPRLASHALGHVLVEGDPQANFASGLELTAAGGIIVDTTKAFTLDKDGWALVPVQARNAGALGNLSENLALKTLEPNATIKSITIAPPGLSGGFDEETWQELQARVLERIRQPPHGGAGFDYPKWLRSKFDIRAVNVVPEWIGRGSVGVIVAMKATDEKGNASGRAPTEAEIDAMMDYLGRPGSSTGVRPVTAHVVIVPASPKIIDLTISIKPDTIAVRKAIEEAYAAFMLTIGDENDTYNLSPIGAVIEPSRLSEALSSAGGEYAHKLIAPSSRLTLERTEYPVAGKVTFEGGI